MAQELMLTTLLNLGFKQQDAEVYVFLVLNGSQNAKDIADNLKKYKGRISSTLRKLEDKKIIRMTPSVPAQFSAIPFDRVLDKLIRDNVEQINRIEQEKERILTLWKSRIKSDPAIGQ